MKKDIDEAHDLTDPAAYRRKIREEDRKSKAPCGHCPDRRECKQPFYCSEYKAWKKRYMNHGGL